MEPDSVESPPLVIDLENTAQQSDQSNQDEEEVLPELQQLLDGERQIGSCPVCSKSFRQTSYASAVINSIRTHIRSKAGSCSAHDSFRWAAIHPSDGVYRCPANPCSQTFPNQAEAWAHFIVMSDEVHTRCKVRHEERPRPSRGSWPGYEIRNYRERSLYESAKSNDTVQLQQLVFQGVDPNAGGEDGYTPLMAAVSEGHFKVVQFLLYKSQSNTPGIGAGNDCLINRQNRYGQTALSIAAQNNEQEIVNLLLKAQGADGPVDVTLKGNSGLNAAQMARAAGHTTVANMICEHDSKRQIERSIDMLMQAVKNVTKGSHFASVEERLATVSEDLGLSHYGAKIVEEDDYFLDDDTENTPTAHQCIICLSSQVEIVFLPCWHAICCRFCATTILHCPICRVEVFDKKQIYLP